MAAKSEGQTTLKRIKRRVKNLLGRLRPGRVKKLEDDLKQHERTISRISSAAKGAITDAVSHMWGGYAEAGSRKLLALADCPYVMPSLRAMACYELARFYADTGHPYSAARMMSNARTFSRTYMRGTRQRVLELEMLLETNDAETARRRTLEYIKFREDDPNYRIAHANYYYRIGDLKQQLSIINDLYKRHDMATIQIDDPDEPFLSLAPGEPTVPIENGPKVSVFISSHNAAPYLKLAVGCMQRQTWQNLEIIVTDDCSTDDSLTILKQMAAEDPRLVIIENTENHGTYGNRNRMLDICTGDYVTVHDADDWSHPQMIEHQMQHILANPEIRMNSTLMCRVSRDLKFHIRPSRASLEYCHKNYPGFLIKTADLKALGGWDPVMANADAEFERRFREVHGKDAFALVNPTTTYSFFLVHENSLTQQKLMNLRSLTFGSRSEYQHQSAFWVKQRRDLAQRKGLKTEPFVVNGRPNRSDPFPSPNGLLVPRHKKDVLNYDVLIISDLFLLGGTRSCNVNYVKILNAMGKRVAMFNWPRGNLRYAEDIHPDYRQLAQDGLIEIVTWEDTVKAKDIIVHHPPVANMELDHYPTIETERVSVLINQLPFQTTERVADFYNPAQVTRRLQRILGCDNVEWIAISPLTHDYISEYAADIVINDQIWYPPIFVEHEDITTSIDARFTRIQKDGPHFARHCRDHWTKWPKSSNRAAKMYMHDAGHQFSILGGDKAIRRNIGKDIPDTWKVYSFDSISVSDLLNNADIYLNFNNEIYIEEFGRNVMESMLYGVPVIADSVFGKTFGDAILVAGDEGPEEWVERLCRDKSFFTDRVRIGQEFVETHCATASVREKLEHHFG